MGRIKELLEQGISHTIIVNNSKPSIDVWVRHRREGGDISTGQVWIPLEVYKEPIGEISQYLVDRCDATTTVLSWGEDREHADSVIVNTRRDGCYGA